MIDHRARVLDAIRNASLAVLEYNLTPEGQANPFRGLDFNPDDEPAPAADPVLEVREDGAALLRDAVAYRAEAADSEDKLRQAWAASPECKVYGMIPEIARRPGLTERQRGNILMSCGRANHMALQRQPGESDRDYAGHAYFGFDYDVKTKQPIAAIMDCAAYLDAQTSSGFPGSNLADVRRYMQLAERAWIASRPRGTVPIIGNGKK